MKNTVFSNMKKGKLLSIIAENNGISLSNMNDDSFYDGHKFVEYGKNIENISLIMPSTDEEDFTIDKDKLSINWGAKFEFRNSGVEGVKIEVLGIDAKIITSGEGESRSISINFAEFKIELLKEKSIEVNDVYMFVKSIEIDAEQKIVKVVISV